MTFQASLIVCGVPHVGDGGDLFQAGFNFSVTNDEIE
jgi:hypothetical protein